MQVKREVLLNKLQQVEAGLASREILEQSASFVFKDKSIWTLNDEVLCEAPLEVGFEAAVHARQLLALLNKMGDEYVDVLKNPKKEGELLIQGKRGRAGVTMSEEISLPLETVEEPKEWHPIHAEFGDAINLVKGSASKDDLHFNLTCIHLHPEYVEACDGYQMTRCTIKTGIEEDCLLKSDSAAKIAGMGFTHVSEGDSWIHFKNKDLRLSLRRWIQPYVELDELLNFKGELITLPGGLAEAVEKAEIFSIDNSAENQVKVQMKQNKLRIKGEGAHGWYEERNNISYTGTPLSFMIPPKLLTEITKRTNDCHINNERLKIKSSGNFVFVACLGVIED